MTLPALPLIASLAAAYLIGSIPFAVILTRRLGIDIFTVGTGNPGASNVFRKVGRWQGAAILVLDIVKGIAPIYLAVLLQLPDYLLPAVTAATIIGVWFPLFTRFRGGAGLAAAVGSVMALQGAWVLATIPAAAAALAITRSGPHAAIALAPMIAAIALFTGPDWTVIAGLATATAMMLGRLWIVEIPRDRRGDRPDADGISS